jgi:DNA-directed RNA polymerase I subunit RPA1
LREIIMTASKTLKTPTMSIPLVDSLSEASATRLARSFTKLSLMELIAGYRGVTVRETLMTGEDGSWERAYYIVLKLHPAERISAAFGLSLKDVAKCVGLHMIPELARLMKIELKRSATQGDINIMKVVGSQSTNQVKESRGEDDMEVENDDNQDPNSQPTAKDDLTDEEDNASGDEGGEEDGVAASKYNRSEDREASYGIGDDGEDASGDGDSVQPDVEMSPVDGPATTTDVNTALPSAPAAGEVKVDKRTNSIILAPLRVDPSTRPLLMVGLVERAAERVLIRSRKNVDQAFVNKEEGRGRCLQTAGVNFHELWSLDSTVVDHNGLMSNDTWAIRCAYGVEAARSNIVEQIRSVFGAYGIEVNPRHLTLIADYMTYEGGYKAMNRIGMEEMSSTLLQMSFETTAHFLTQAALSNAKDDLESPSANIVLGRPIRQGTGAFDVLVK